MKKKKNEKEEEQEKEERERLTNFEIEDRFFLCPKN